MTDKPAPVPVSVPNSVIEHLTNQAKLPERAKRVLSGEGAAMVFNTRGLRVLRRRLEEEAAVIRAARDLEELEGAAVSESRLLEALNTAKAEIRHLHDEVYKARQGRMQQTAEPAVAVNSEGTGK